MFKWIISIALQTGEKFSRYMLIKYTRVEFIIEYNCVLSHADRLRAIDELLYLCQSKEIKEKTTNISHD